MAIGERELFVSNLDRLIKRSRMSKRQIANQADVNASLLSRWLESGVRRGDRRSRKPLERICRLLRVDPDDMWEEPAPPASLIYPNKVRQLYEHWEELGSSGQELTRLLDRWIAAIGVAERFIEEERDLAAVVVKVKKLRDQCELQLYLESLVRDWELGAKDAYRRLIETTQRFLAVALPKEAEPLSGWFIQTHPRRWKQLLKSRKLDNEAELFLYIRNLIAEGLSPLETYESLLRLSSEPPVISRRRKVN